MSVVAFKEGILAADTCAYGGRGQASPGQKAKIHRLEDGTRVGIVSAVLGEPERFLAWMKDGEDRTKWTGDKPDLRALIIRPSGEVFLADDSIWFSGPIECATYGIGSGGDYAQGAMAMGASAKQAVYVACDLDPYCGAPVQTLERD